MTNIKKFEVNGISWDCPNPADYNLPNSTLVECADDEDIADVLSDAYGWCINSIEEIIALN